MSDHSSHPVHIVRTSPDAGYTFASLFVSLIGFLITTWLVMLLLPVAFGPEWAWGYWRVAAAILVVRLVLPRAHPLLVPAQFAKNKRASLFA